MKNLTILTGAGMSAESGISTFRDSDGLWEKYRVEDVATPEAFKLNPELVLEFYNKRREQLLEVEPNGGHYGIAALEKFFNVQIITQNVDDLHERAGSTKVLHLHGELMKVCAVDDFDRVYTLSREKPTILKGDVDERGKQLRPFIVWFGEAVPMIEPAIDMIGESDIVVVVGTSLKVYPAAGLLNYVRKGQPIFLIDPKPVETYRTDVRIIALGASEGIKVLTELLKEYHEQ